MLLQSQDRFDAIASLNAETGEMRFLTKQDSELSSGKTVGLYSHLARQWVALYVHRGKMFLSTGNTVHPVGPDTRTTLIKGGVRNVLTVTEAGKPVFSFDYERPKIDPPLSVDPTPFVEEEHHDFGLLIHNVLSNDKRREAFKAANSQ